MMITNKVRIAVTVRAHEDIIIQFIDYHLSKGIDEIYIFLMIHVLIKIFLSLEMINEFFLYHVMNITGIS